VANRIWFQTNAPLSGTAFQEFSLIPPASGVSSPNVGWTVAKTAAGNSSNMQAGTEQPAGTFNSTTKPASTFSAGGGRTTEPLTGTFASANWTFIFELTAVSAAAGQDGFIAFRMWRSANGNGSGAVQVTVLRQFTSTFTDLAIGATTEISSTFNPGSFSLNNEFLFFQVALEISGAASNNQADVIFRIGQNETRVVSAPFSETFSRTINDTIILLSDDDFLFEEMFYGRSLADTANIADSTTAEIIGDAVIDRNVSDAVNVTDAVSIVVEAGAIQVNASDDVDVTDAVATDVFFDRSLSDSINVADDVSASVGLERNTQDSVSVTDELLTEAEYSRSASDTIGVTDDVQTAVALERSASDVIDVSDDLFAETDYVREVSDSINVTDDVQAVVALESSASDAIDVSDVLLTETDYTREADDAVDVADAVAVQISGVIDVDVSDDVDVEDELLAEADYIREMNDVIDAVDAIDAQIIADVFERTISDSIDVTDAVAAELTLEKEINDTVDVTDSISVETAFDVLLSDAVAVEDELITETDYVRELFDSVNVTDAVTATAAGTSEVQISDDVDITDDLRTEAFYVRSETDDVEITDDATIETELERFLVDSFSVADSVTAQIVGFIVVEVSDSISIADSLSAQKIGVQTANASDVVRFTDSIDVRLFRPAPKPKPKPKPQPVPPPSPSTARAPAPFVFEEEDLLEQLLREKQVICEPDPQCIVVVPEPEPDPRQELPPREFPRVISYIDRVDSSQHHQLVENRVDNRVENRYITNNFGNLGMPEQDNTVRNLMLVFFGVSFIALLATIASTPPMLYDTDER
jgi:hypothetical protein